MNCTKHPEKEATGTCTYCGKFFCEDCLVDVNGRNYCREHVGKAIDQQNHSTEATPNIIINNSSSSSASVSAAAANFGGMMFSPRSRLVALLLCIFMGFFGVHQFYVGKSGTGILYLFTMGLFGIGWIIDIVRIATGTFRDVFGRPLIRW